MSKHIEAPQVEPLTDVGLDQQFMDDQTAMDRKFEAAVDRYKTAMEPGALAVRAAHAADQDTQERWNTLGTDKQKPRS